MLEIDKLAHRDQIPMLLTKLGFTGQGVEIGVQAGDYSATLLQASTLSRLFSVDPWCGGGEEELSPVELYSKAVWALAPFGLRSVVLRMYSADAVELFDDGSLDFVYLDGWHFLPGITADLALWWPKIRKGGILAGHDYDDFHKSVPEAVDAFVTQGQLQLHLTTQDALYEGHVIRSWLIPKT